MAEKINKELARENLKFKIDQLRKDKMIYALDSIAITFIAELIYVYLSVSMGNGFSFLAATLVILFPLAFFVFAMAGNTMRYMKIKKLEDELSK